MPGKERPVFKTVGLSLVFVRMTNDLLTDVVNKALTGRDQVSGDTRAALARAVSSSVTVDGFRNAGIAPAIRLQEPVEKLVCSRDNLARAVLLVWAESQVALRDAVAAHLSEKSLWDGEPDYSANKIRTFPPDRGWNEAIEELSELHSAFGKDDLLLMSYYVSGRMPADAKDSDSPPASGELAGEFPDVFEQALDILRSLPSGAPEWEQAVPGFIEAIGEIKEAKQAAVREAAELDAEVLAISAQHADLLAFFEWNAAERLAARPQPWADIQAARQVIKKLAGLLAEYAPVHPMAAVRSEEASRAPRRAGLQEQVDGVLAQFEALEVQSPPAERQAEQPTPGHPPVALAVPEAQPLISEAELASLRAGNERLSAENRSLASDNRHLSEQASELESDFNESRNLAEMWRISYQDMLRAQEPAAARALPEFESVAQVVQLAERRLVGRLRFLLNSKSDTEIPFDNPQQIWDALEWLATTYYQAKTGESGESDFDLSLRRTCGWRYTPDQSNTTVGQYRDYYETRVGNRRRELREHIGTGNGYHRGTIRIAFAWEADEQKVVVGFMGRHQRTDAS